jgi:outer membrane receptor protein involved in Fe transport
LFQGNPDIQPSYSNGVDLGYLKRFEQITLNGSVYFRRQTNVFTFILEDTGDQTLVGGTLVPILRRYPINLASQNRYGFELNSSASFSKKWRVNGNINFFANDLKGSHNGKIYDKKSASWSGRLSNTFTLPTKIDWQTNVYYRGPSENAESKSKGFASVSTAISKDVLKDNGTLTFRVSDVFNSQRRRSNLLTETIKNYSEFQWREPSYTLSFTYRFNERKSRRPSRGQGSNQGESFDF